MNPEHRSCSAVSCIAAAAELTLATPGIDLTNNALTTLFNNPDKLMPDRSVEPRVPTRNLQIGITNPRQHHTHQHLIVRFLYLFNCNSISINSEGKH